MVVEVVAVGVLAAVTDPVVVRVGVAELGALDDLVVIVDAVVVHVLGTAGATVVVAVGVVGIQPDALLDLVAQAVAVIVGRGSGGRSDEGAQSSNRHQDKQFGLHAHTTSRGA